MAKSYFPRYPQIPWRKVADIGNFLRYDDESVETKILLAVALNDLPILEEICQIEYAKQNSSDLIEDP